MPADDAPLTERVAHLEGEVETLAQNVLYLVQQRDPSRVRSWLLEDDGENARLLLEDLAGWVGKVWVHYGDQLPECWLYHPAIVEELWSVMGVHRACFRKGGTAQMFADWHARYRPAAADRIRKYAPSCALSEHQPGETFDPAAVPTVPRTADISSVAAQWISTGTAPYPTPA